MGVHGCDRSSGSSSWPASTAPRPGTVASLVPAATEILIGMGLGDHLVAVSNFDLPRDGTRNLPKVGDYQSTDWERLAALRPAAMITQFAPDRLPQGMTAKSDQLGIRLVNVQITRLDDLYVTMTTLGEAAGERSKGQAAADALKDKLETIARRGAKGRRVPALIVLDDSARGVAGHNNYLDDLLTLAGGENVIRGKPFPMPYPSIDRETLLALDPEIILQILPDASPQVRNAAARMWQGLPELRAVRSGQVHITNPWWAQLPTQHVAELADFFLRAIDGARTASTTPAQRAGWNANNAQKAPPAPTPPQ
jgi:ABC-type Fe3+-hydroxamate transport system substrate-binding protein